MSFILIAVLLAILSFLNILAPVSGSATVTPLLAALVGGKDAVAVASLYFLLNGIPRVFLFRKYIRWDIVRILLPVSIIGAIIGGLFFVNINGTIVTVIIFCFLLWFLYQKIVSVLLTKHHKDKKPTKHGILFVGLFSGALQGTGLAGSDLRNGYLLSRGLSIPVLQGTTALVGISNFLFASAVRVYSGELTWAVAAPVLAIFPLLIIATYIGRHITLKLSTEWQGRLGLIVMLIAVVILSINLANELFRF